MSDNWFAGLVMVMGLTILINLWLDRLRAWKQKRNKRHIEDTLRRMREALERASDKR